MNYTKAKATAREAAGDILVIVADKAKGIKKVQEELEEYVLDLIKVWYKKGAEEKGGK